MKKIVLSAFVLISILTSCNQSQNWEYKTIYFDAVKIESSDKAYISTDETFLNTVSSKSVIPADSSLTNLGKEGWEIASTYLEQETVYTNLLARGKSVDGLKENIRPQRLVVIFKRPLK
jgi:uncharacterized lipoprotein NlpE involved in copper resistance